MGNRRKARKKIQSIQSLAACRSFSKSSATIVDCIARCATRKLQRQALPAFFVCYSIMRCTQCTVANESQIFRRHVQSHLISSTENDTNNNSRSVSSRFLLFLSVWSKNKNKLCFPIAATTAGVAIRQLFFFYLFSSAFYLCFPISLRIFYPCCCSHSHCTGLQPFEWQCYSMRSIFVAMRTTTCIVPNSLDKKKRKYVGMDREMIWCGMVVSTWPKCPIYHRRRIIAQK